MTTLSMRPLHSVSDLIHPVFARFTDPATEQAYLSHVAGATRRHLLIAFFVWAALLVVFAMPDYAALGPGPDFNLLFGARVAGAIVIIGYALACLRSPDLAMNFQAITLIEILAMVVVFLLYFIRPEVAGFNIGVTLVMIVGAYLLIPNLLSWTTLLVAYMVAGSLLAVWVTQAPGPTGLISLFIVFLLSVATGLVIAHRLQMLRRSQFALLMDAEQRNAELAREVQRRQALEEELQRQAATDPLTGLHNRRGYELLFDQEFKRARRKGTPLSVGVLDLDHFKALNDTHGHGAGDQVLTALADEWSRLIREPDVLGRLGGEEFLALMPDTATADAVNVMERLRAHAEAAPRELGVATVPVTVTIGVTELADSDTSFQDMIARADEALYRGKDQGRNRVISLPAGEGPPTSTPPTLTDPAMSASASRPE